MRKPRWVLLAMLAMVVAGCGSKAIQLTPRAIERGRPYQLYTHCGIEWARIGGTFWRTTPMSDGNGNPPTGWGNPFQAGTLSFRNRTTARFSSPAGSVLFKRTNSKRPPIICS
jgi:hypothetical protein